MNHLIAFDVHAFGFTLLYSVLHHLTSTFLRPGQTACPGKYYQ
jgi:hypothetical protein